MLLISKKYLVDPSEIYKLNKKAIDGVYVGMILNIPKPINSKKIITEYVEQNEIVKSNLLEQNDRNKTISLTNVKDNDNVTQSTPKETEIRNENINKLSFSNNNNFIDHSVQYGETLTSISNQYGVPIENIYNENKNELKKELQVGQTIKILVPDNLYTSEEQYKSQTTTVSSEIFNSKNEDNEAISHHVTKGETLYSISKKYNISVDNIINQNEDVLKKGLQAGQDLILKNNFLSTKAINTNNTNIKLSDKFNSTDEKWIKHVVEPKETLYSLSKKYNITIQEIQEQNQLVLRKGLQIGQVILIRIKNNFL